MSAATEAEKERILSDAAWWEALEPLLGARLHGWSNRHSATFLTPFHQTFQIPGSVGEALHAHAGGGAA